jgi:GntR family transcriptional regulator
MVISTDTRLNQVKAYMLNYISQNKLKRNDQLPSESAIAKELGVSRNTLREAYVSLENDGVIVRRHGIGTFVAHPPFIRDSLNEFSPFAQIIRDVGYTPHFQTLSMDMETAKPTVRDLFRMETGEKVRCIRRIVLADQKPVIYAADYIDPAIDAQVDSWDDFDGNMVEFLSGIVTAPLHQIQSLIRAASCAKQVSDYLHLPAGSPILSVRSTIYTADNQPVTYSDLSFNSEVIELNIVRMIRKNYPSY